MLLNIDFHIHTALSPCGDEDMTPNNIVNMAMLNGLDAIAITDHNTVGNAAACMKVGERVGVVVIPGMELQTREDVHVVCLLVGVVVIPGMELQTREDVHVVCLFDSLEKAQTFEKIVHESLPELANNEKLFGEQLFMDDGDNVTGKMDRLLLTASSLSISEAFEQVSRLGGVFIPAHVDKNANSIIANLGFIPEDLDIKNIECKSVDKLNRFIMAGLVKDGYRIIRSSDAHYLQDIQQEGITLACEDKSILAIIDTLNS